MQLITIRHAATGYNEAELINGQQDEPLSAKGQEQIPQLIDAVSSYQFDIVYASTMRRAVQCAQPIAEYYGVPLKQDARLIEVGLGSFEGKPWDTTIPYFGVNSSGLLSSCKYDLTPFGGESAEQVRTRVQSFLGYLKRRPEQTPMVVAHGGIMRMIYHICTGETTGRIPNLSVQTFEL